MTIWRRPHWRRRPKSKCSVGLATKGLPIHADATAAGLPPGAFAFDDNRALPPLEEATEEQVLGGAGDEVLADADATAAVLPPGAPALLDYESYFEDEIRYILGELSEQDVDNIKNGVLCLNEDPLDGETFPNFNWGSEGDATHI